MKDIDKINAFPRMYFYYFSAKQNCADIQVPIFFKDLHAIVDLYFYALCVQMSLRVTCT